jgi:hypothetical protein
MRYLAFILGVLFIAIAFLADRIGLDHNPDWGASRYLLLGSGIILATAAGFVHLLKTNQIRKSTRDRLADLAQATIRPLKQIRESLLVPVILTIVLFFASSAYVVWYTSEGMFPIYTPVANRYLDLGEAFLHGQVALLEKPDPRLGALANPYDYNQRKNIPYIWDVSYYNGKYYLYWGPVPAFGFALVEELFRARPPEQMMVIFSYIGLGGVLSVLLFKIRSWYFPQAPGLVVPFFFLAAQANLPVMFILGRCQVYETSVITGQFFLILGLAAGLFYLNHKSWPWLVLAGLSWGLAVGSRVNLAVSVGVFGAFVLVEIWRARRGNPLDWRAGVALLAPLFLCGLGLAFYNWIRFENPLETGLAYQLTIQVYHKQHFSPAYVLSNLYMYLFYPLAHTLTFPYFPSIAVDAQHLPAWAAPPAGKINEDVFVGLLPGLPVLWLLGIQVPALALAGTWNRMRTKLKGWFSEIHTRRLRIAAILGLAALLQFTFLLFYYFGAMRFIVDFYPTLLLTIFFLGLELDDRLKQALALRILFWMAVGLLMIRTAAIALLAGFDIPPQMFRFSNPQLLKSIAIRSNQVSYTFLKLAGNSGITGLVFRALQALIGFQ